MCVLTHRMQILLEEDRYQRLARQAEFRRTSIAALIRKAIDKTIDADMERRRKAMASFLGSEPISLPEDPADLRKELDEEHERKFRELGLL